MKVQILILLISVSFVASAYANEHLTHENHAHNHGSNCGHVAEWHEDHFDYNHDGHDHHGHDLDGGGFVRGQLLSEETGIPIGYATVTLINKETKFLWVI